MSRDGLTRVEAGDQRRVSYPVVMVITDQRVMFVAAEEMGKSEVEDAGSLGYGDVAGIGVENGVVALRSTEGVSWRFPLPPGNQQVVDPVVRHLRWVGDVRGRVVAVRSDVHLAVDQIADCAEAMAWDDAVGTYERVRDDLDWVIGAVQRTLPIDDDVLAPELTDLERKLEGAYAEALIERAESWLTLGRQLVENEDYEQARDVLSTARADHAAASHHADAVQRGDAFQFGQQRELQERLQRLDWEFDAVAAEPIRLAHEARVLAENADDVDTAITHWEAAFRRYETVITLEVDDEVDYYDGNDVAATAELEEAAEHLVDLRRERAADRWSTGVSRYEADRMKETIRCLEAAIEDAERALELAECFRPAIVDALAERLAEMRHRTRRVRQTASDPLPSAADAADDAAADGSTAPEADRPETDLSESEESPGERGPPDARTVRDIDTHHQITFRDGAIEQSSESDGEAGDSSQNGSQSSHSQAGTARGSGNEPSGPERGTDALAPGDPGDAE
ncbi:hypothetical protein ACKVMT_03530 [Halobacteriales archaeon Cl-PHB]